MSNLSKDNKDILRLISSNTHIGTKNLSHQMKPYVESKTSEGVHLINPKLTLEKIKLAARVIVTVENPEDIIVLLTEISKFRPSQPAPTAKERFSNTRITPVACAGPPPDGLPVC